MIYSIFESIFKFLPPPPPLSKKQVFQAGWGEEGKGESTRARGSTVQRSVCQPRALQGRLKLHPFLSEKDNLGGSDQKKREYKKKTLSFNLNFSDYCTRMASPPPSVKKYMYKKWGGLCFQVSGSQGVFVFKAPVKKVSIRERKLDNVKFVVCKGKSQEQQTAYLIYT